jgi:hypothetical protein
MKRKGNLTQTISNIVEDATEFPVVLTNKDFTIIEESFYIIKELEDKGYTVKTFSDKDTGVYGIEVYE